MACSTASTTTRNFSIGISLNNIAVELIRRRCYRQAVETLNDAVDSIKEGAAEDLQRQRLRRGKTRMEEAEPDTKNPHSITVVTEGSYTRSLDAALTSPTSSSGSFVVALDEASETVQYTEIVSAVVLSNMGVAYYSLASCTESSSFMALVEGAFDLTQLAYDLLQNLWSQRHGSDYEEDDLCLTRTLLMSMIVLYSLGAFAFELEWEFDASTYWSRLEAAKDAFDTTYSLVSQKFQTPQKDEVSDDTRDEFDLEPQRPLETSS